MVMNRSDLPGDLARFIGNHAVPGRKCFDPVFRRALTGLMPEWIPQVVQEAVLRNQERLLELAQVPGSKRPSSKSDDIEERKLYSLLLNYTKSRYHLEFTEKIKALRPDWFENSRDVKKKAILEWANRPGSNRPSRAATLDSYEGGLADVLSKAISKHGDPEFTRKIKALRPDWFEDQVKAKKTAILALAGKLHSERPPVRSPLGSVLALYINPSPKNKKMFDPEFTRKIKALRPDWFENSKVINQNRLMELAASGAAKPSSYSRDEVQRALGVALKNYTAPARADLEFARKIKALRPDWFNSARGRHTKGLRGDQL